MVVIIISIHIYFIHFLYHFDWSISLGEGLYGSLFICLSAWSIVLLIRSYPTTTVIYVYALTVAFAVSLVATLFISESLKVGIITKNEAYKPWLHLTLPIRFVIILIFNCWVATNGALRKNISVLDTRFQQQADASILLKEAELFKLRQQLQPHFLYNSLNSISALIMIAPDSAQEMIGKLSDFLRSSVKRESEDTVPVSEELEYIQSYLDIEAVRFGDRLRINIEKSCTDDVMVPPFLLQPILENAIKFGLYGNTGIINISISIALELPMLIITVTNPYDADNQPPRGTGFGLEGINRRLYLLYARTDLLETKKDGRFFTTILKIPQRHVQSHIDRR